MESWSIEDNRLSFLHSTPFSFSLYHREGPNHVEIFDITRIPSRNAISETTCLCDIFGDDYESPTLSSSPPSGSLAKAEEDDSMLAEDTPNNSSGSYHTANGSEQLSDSSETFEDSKEALSPVPPLAVYSPESRCVSPLSKPNGTELSPDLLATPPSDQSNHSIRSVAPLSLLPEPRSANISPGHSTTTTSHNPGVKFPSLKASCSGLSSEHGSIDISAKSLATVTPCKHRGTAPSPDPEDTDLFYETSATTPPPEDWDILDPTESRATKPRITTIPPVLRSISPDLQPRAIPSKLEPNVTSSKIECRNSPPALEITPEIPDPEPRGTSLEPEQRALSAEPEPRTTCPGPGPKAKSPEIKPRTLFTKLEPKGVSPKPESRAISSKLEPSFTSFEPELRDKSQIIQPRAVSPRLERSATSPEPESSSASSEQEFRTPSPEPERSGTCPEPESMVISNNLEPSTCLEPEPRDKSPVIISRALSPRQEPSATHPESESSAASSEQELKTPSSESGPSVPEQESRASTNNLEPSFALLEPEPRHRALGFITGDLSPRLQPCATTPEPEFRTSSPGPEPCAVSPETESRAISCNLELCGTSLEPELRDKSPVIQLTAISPILGSSATFPESEFRVTSNKSESSTSFEAESIDKSAVIKPKAISPRKEPSAISQEAKLLSPESEPSATSPKPEPRFTYPELNTIHPSSEDKIPANSPKPRGPEVSFGPEATFPSAESIENVLIPETTITSHSSAPAASGPLQDSRATDPLNKLRQINPPSEARSTCLSLKSKTATDRLETWCWSTSPVPQSTVLPSEQHDLEIISPQPRCPTISAESKNPELFEFIGQAPDYSATAEVLELGDQDHLLKSTMEPSDPRNPLKLHEKQRGRMSAVLAKSNVSQGLQFAQPLFSSETVLIRPPGNQNSEAAPSREGQESISRLQEPEFSTSGESPTLHPKQGGGQLHRDKRQREGGEEEHRREQQGGGEGEENQEKTRYGEQQVELSFSARNRRAPVSPSSAPTCRELQTGMTAGCYSDCLLITQQQQQQNPLRPHNSQKEIQACARKPQLVPQSTRSSTSHPAPKFSTETSSMGSEMDEADNEVKWFTDLAFRSLSSPQADYLDVYNSSHRSSTNVSQLSTEDSPGASAWSAYADLRGSFRHEGDNLPNQPPPTSLVSDRVGMTRRFEMGGFECVDVVLESREDVRRGKRTVPKRQIQLKRRDTGESCASDNDVAATDAANEASPVQRRSRDTLLRQHSTPAAVQEEIYTEAKPEPNERKQKFQKSLSLDETSSKTKNASCLIKGVLSKKMQHKQNLTVSQPSLQSGGFCFTVGQNASTESSHSITETLRGSTLSSELPSDCSLSEEDLPLQVDPAPQSNSVRQLCRHTYSPLQSRTSSIEIQRNNTGKLGMKSELVIPLDSTKMEKRSGREPEKQKRKEKEKKSDNESENQSNIAMEKQRGSEWKQNDRSAGKQRGRDGVRQQANENSGDSANSIAGNTGPTATRAPDALSGMTNRNQECYTRSENYKQQSARNIFMSKTPEIMLKPCSTREKKKSSMNVNCLPGDSEAKQEESYMAPSPDGMLEKETQNHTMEKKTEEHTENGGVFQKNKPKGPVHKVRDVRKLVKNTYNLSFKATTIQVPDSVSRAEVEKPPPMQIEYISRKVEGLTTSGPGERQAKKAQVPTQTTAQVHSQGPPQVSSQVPTQEPAQLPVQKITQTTSLHITPRGCVTEAGAATLDTIATDGGTSEAASHVEIVPQSGTQHPKLGSIPKHTSKEREVSTLMYLQNGATEGGLESGALPPLGLTATSCSHSVSMLLKEKGFQADIGVCDTPANDLNPVPKHVNRLEVPLQSCSKEDTPCESSDHVLPPASTSPSAPTSLMDPLEESHSGNPTLLELRELDFEGTNLKPGENNKRAQDTTPSSPQALAAPTTSSNRPQQTGVKTVSTRTRKPAGAGAVAATVTTSSCEQKSTSVATQLHSDTHKSMVLATSTKISQPTLTAISNYKQKPPSPSNPQEPKLMCSDTQEQAALVSSGSSSSNQSSVPTTAQSPSCPQQPAVKITSTKRMESNSLRYYASDDPPSYDERESFSPLLLTDLYSKKVNRYHPPVQAPPCSCAADGVSSSGPPDLTPPAPRPSTSQAPPSHTQAPPSVAAPPPAHHHWPQSDGRCLSYKPGSPKAAQPSLAQPAQLFQQPPPGLPAFPPPLQQPRPENMRQPPPGLPPERRLGYHRSPQHPASLSGSSTCSGHSTHSPGVPPLDVRPQYLCSPQGFVSSFSSEFGGEGGGGSGMLYPESGGSLGFGQSPRRVLLDPETGKYFYIEVPVQPLRKMLFDPEIGQYVEVLIPQQTMPHSSLYPPVAAPYPSIHNPSMYAPHYLPYSVPPHSQPPSPRHPEARPPQGLHQNSGGFGRPRSRSPKPEPQSHSPLDQSYLESMYYIPTGMTASPNPAAPEFYQKLSPSLPNSVGKRS